MVRRIVLSTLLLTSLTAAAQNVGINANGAAPDPSALLDIDATALPANAKGGLLIPRLTTTERNAIAAPVHSLLIFNHTEDRFEYFDASFGLWRPLLSDRAGWSLTGNDGTNVFDHYLGTSDPAPFSIRTDGQERIRISEQGAVIFAGGTATTASGHDFNGNRVVWTPGNGAFRAGRVTLGGYGALGAGSFAAGTDNTATGENSVALGQGNESRAPNATTIGRQNDVDGTGATAIGRGHYIDGPDGMALGTGNSVNAANAIALGNEAWVQADRAIAIGTDPHVSVEDGIGIGREHDLRQGTGTIGVGTRISSSGASNSFAFGSDIDLSSHSNSLMIGFGDPFGPFTKLMPPGPNIVGIGNGGRKPTFVVTGFFGGDTRTGHVGIGTVTPNAKLHVMEDNDSHDDDLFQVSSASGGTVLVAQRDRTVGINQTAPGAHLHVTGDFTGGMPMFLADGVNMDPTLIVTSAHAVGIGTSAPLAGLHVRHDGGVFVNNPDQLNAGGILLRVDDFGEASLQNTVSGRPLTLTAMGDVVVAALAGNTVLQPTGLGRVGVGTPSPTAMLHVEGGLRLVDGNEAAGNVLVSDALGNATWQSATGLSDWGLAGNAGTNPATNFVGTTDDRPLVLRAFNTELMRLHTAGRVEIGSQGASAPNVPSIGLPKVWVASGNTTDDNIIFQASHTNTASSAAFVSAKSRGTVAAPTAVVAGENMGRWATVGYGTASFLPAASIRVVAEAAPTTTHVPSRIDFDTNNELQRMTIRADGKVGIGTPNPAALLHLSQGASTATANANAKLVLEDDASTYAHFLTTGGMESGLLFGNAAGNIRSAIIFNSAMPDGLDFRTGGNTARMSIDGSGQVGIGPVPATSGPTTMLDVDGGLTVRRPADIILVNGANNVTVGDRSYLRISSGTTTGTTTIALSSGLVTGQVLVIECLSSAVTTGFTLADSGSVNLAAARALSDDDTLTLIWNGTDWLELSFVNN